MNITDYNRKTRYLMPVGSCLLKQDYMVASADEFFYKFLNVQEECSFLERIHPGDQRDFLDAAEGLDKNAEYLLVRFQTVENEYRIMMLRLLPDKRVVNGFRYISVVVDDIIASMDKFVQNRVNLTKYRTILSMSDSLYFDYTQLSNILNIYIYSHNKSYLILSDDFDRWIGKMLEKYIWNENDKKKFQAFCMYMKEGVDNFKVQFSTTFFSRSTRNDLVRIVGSTIYDHQDNRIVTGAIYTEGQLSEQPYYTTEASKDAATGLMNKRAIMEYAAQKLLNEKDEQYFLMVIDIDDFKHINDTYGHLYGDTVILKIAECFKRIVGVRGIVARFGGDEFVVLLEKGDLESLEFILQTVFNNIKVLFLDEHPELNVTLSAGIAGYPQDGTTYDELFLKADKALYVAKANGKNSYVIYNDEIYDSIGINYEHPRLTGLKSVASRGKRTELFSEMILELNAKGRDAVFGVIRKICDLFDVNGVKVYGEEDMKCLYYHGRYNSAKEVFSLHENEEYAKLLSESGTLVIDNVSHYEDKSFIGAFAENEIASTINCLYRSDGVVKAAVTFDVFNTSRKWLDEDVTSLVSLGKLIGQIVS